MAWRFAVGDQRGRCTLNLTLVWKPLNSEVDSNETDATTTVRRCLSALPARAPEPVISWITARWPGFETSYGLGEVGDGVMLTAPVRFCSPG